MSQYQPFQFLLVRLKGYMGISLGGGGCISIPTGTIKSYRLYHPCHPLDLISIPTGTIKRPPSLHNCRAEGCHFNSYWYD